MSVQSEINRISGNVTAALAAIAEKGVSVPDGSKSDALASLIAAIEAGGSGGEKIATGTLTTNGALSGLYDISILDFVPTFAAIIRSEIPTTQKVMIGAIEEDTISVGCYFAYKASMDSYSRFENNGLTNVRAGFLTYDKTTHALRYYNSSTASFMDGTYAWVAVG